MRLGESAALPPPPSVDDEGLDEFLSSHGFEFVEGDRSYRRPTQDTDRHSDDEDSGAFDIRYEDPDPFPTLF